MITSIWESCQLNRVLNSGMIVECHIVSSWSNKKASFKGKKTANYLLAFVAIQILMQISDISFVNISAQRPRSDYLQS